MQNGPNHHTLHRLLFLIVFERGFGYVSTISQCFTLHSLVLRIKRKFTQEALHHSARLYWPAIYIFFYFKFIRERGSLNCPDWTRIPASGFLVDYDYRPALSGLITRLQTTRVYKGPRIQRRKTDERDPIPRLNHHAGALALTALFATQNSRGGGDHSLNRTGEPWVERRASFGALEVPVSLCHPHLPRVRSGLFQALKSRTLTRHSLSLRPSWDRVRLLPAAGTFAKACTRPAAAMLSPGRVSQLRRGRCADLGEPDRTFTTWNRSTIPP